MSRRTVTLDDLKRILERHKLWLDGQADGERADLTDANLVRADLTDANLVRADLTGANLADANLVRANLVRADLTDANLVRANLADANLTDANLTDANLVRADLTGANLTDANLVRADLTGANLVRANLVRANLADANLTDANLVRANLTDADLVRANLTDANLVRANLTDANLTAVRDDVWAILSASPREVAGLRAKIAAGEIDGTCYSGPCCCLVGTLAVLRGCDHESIPGLVPSPRRAAESFFAAIRPGDTPDKSSPAKVALEWIDQWLANMRDAFGPAAAAEPTAPTVAV